ncbi:MAG: hypothetical protein JOY71_24595 [Acetobacteraceae bacterium]|nr:hypothetical protein [Acetobacteraceae bacterium]MBV8525261.1 hypothetical protein [Acetobacteraceae bacterium]MBV8589358.1 hypothetical protein [Acetobacteraceae bacterium]
MSINNIGLAVVGGIGGIGHSAAAISIFGASLVMLALGQLLGAKLIKSAPAPGCSVTATPAMRHWLSLAS